MARFDSIGVRGQPLTIQDIKYDPDTGLLYYIKTNDVIEGVVWSGYKLVKIDGRYKCQHHVAWFLQTGDWPIQIDHKNRCPGDNRWVNLRLADHSKNAQNRIVHKNNKLGIRGVRLRADGFYEPRLMIRGKSIYLGIYKTLDEAIEVRLTAEQEYFTHGSL